MVTGDTSVKKQVQDRSNLIVRSITALVAGPLVLMVVYLGGWPFAVLAFFLAAMSLVELYALGQGRGFQGSILVGIPLLIALVVSYAAQQYILLPVLFVIAGLVAFSLETLRGTQPISQRMGRTGLTLAGLAYAGFPAAFLIAIRVVARWPHMVVGYHLRDLGYGYAGLCGRTFVGQNTACTPNLPQENHRRSSNGHDFRVGGCAAGVGAGREIQPCNPGSGAVFATSGGVRRSVRVVDETLFSRWRFTHRWVEPAARSWWCVRPHRFARMGNYAMLSVPDYSRQLNNKSNDLWRTV